MVFMNFIFGLVIMFIPSVIANSLALYCIIPDLKKQKTLVKQLLLALVIIDICGVTGVTVFQINNVVGYVSSNICSFMCFVAVYFTIFSGALATFMAYERCLALRAPFWYQENMFSCIIWTPLLVVVCVITIICLLPEMGLGDTILIATHGNVSYRQCGSFPSEMFLSRKAAFTVSFGLMGLLLVAANLSCNTAVLVTLRVMKKRILPSQRTGCTYQEFEMTKMLLALSATFLVCWVPMNVELVLIQLGWKSISGVKTFTQTLVGFNFVVDPLIYLIMMRKYRDKIKKFFCCTDTRTDSESSGSTVNTMNNPVYQLESC